MSKENYDKLLSTILKTEDPKTPNMPMDRYIQEAADLEVWCQPDQQQLMSVGTTQETFDTLSERIGALRYAQSIWNKERHSKEEARQEWDKQYPIMEELKDELEHAFRFAFRSRPDLISKVRNIEAGYGHPDTLQDLSDLSVLGKDNKELVSAIGFDIKKLNQAAKMSSEMSKLLATMNGERAENNAAKQTRDKAYVFLKESVDNIREAGKYLFWKDKKRLAGYKSIYWLNKNKSKV